MRLTNRGRHVVSLLSVAGFLMVLGLAGWVEGL